MILGALEQSNLFGPSNKVLYLKNLVIKSGVCFLILFVLVDAILQKVVYFKNKSGKLFINTCNKLRNLVSLKKELKMKNKTLIHECNCIHCQQKLNQINNSKLYWDKLILRKKN